MHVHSMDPPTPHTHIHPFLQGWCELKDVERLKHLLQKIGLFRRISGPAILLRQHERAIQGMIPPGLALH